MKGFKGICNICEYSAEMTVEKHCYNCIGNEDVALHKPDNETEYAHFTVNKKYNDYLEKLRDSGVCNMWGADAYLIKEFGLSHTEAESILLAWIRLKSEGGKKQ